MTIKPDAFIPYPWPNLSVTRRLELTDTELWAIGQQIADQRPATLYGRADVQAIDVRKQSLAITPTKEPRNHADISGWPPDKPSQKMIAQEIAAAAIYFSRSINCCAMTFWHSLTDLTSSRRSFQKFCQSSTLSASRSRAIFTATRRPARRKMDFTLKKRIMDAAGISRALSRLASEIVERNVGTADLLLVGVRRRGVPLAERIADKIEQLEGTRPPTGQLDITLYRDDLSTVGPRPVVNKTDIPIDVTESTIVLVDDVLYTGRTVRAALDELVDFGRPRRVELAVLIDRGHRELPIQADYVGKSVQTTDTEIVKVMLKEYDEDEQVVVVESE